MGWALIFIYCYVMPHMKHQIMVTHVRGGHQAAAVTQEACVMYYLRSMTEKAWQAGATMPLAETFHARDSLHAHHHSTAINEGAAALACWPLTTCCTASTRREGGDAA